MDWIMLACIVEFCASVYCYDSKFSSVLKSNYTNSFKSVKHFKGYENYQLSGELRDYCDTVKDCRDYAYVCNRKMCECAEGYRIDDKNATCVGGVGAKCFYDSHCITNAFCRHQLLCFCKKEFWAPADDQFNCKG